MLVGRNDEVAQLLTVLDDLRRSNAHVLLGDAGIGKSALLDELSREAGRRGMSVTSVTASPAERNLPYAVLHQVLQPLMTQRDRLAPRQREALEVAFGERQTGTTAPLVLGTAVLTLLSDASEQRPLLVLLDDAQWADAGSLESLAFAARRMRGEPVGIVVSARGDQGPTSFAAEFPTLRLGPLDATAALDLLDLQPSAPVGRVRERVVREAAGNPLALIELSAALHDRPMADTAWDSEPLPLNQRLEALYSSRIRELSEPLQQALLLAAVADPFELPIMFRNPPAELDEVDWQPAERLGLLRLSRGGVEFSHPLMRSAVYHGASFSTRATAHRSLAAALASDSDRRAWHLAAASAVPDDAVADELEATADAARRRGGLAGAAVAMARAAELSRDDAVRGRRLLVAGQLAQQAGRGEWVEELSRQALAASSDPSHLLQARLQLGWALAWTNHHGTALAELTRTATDAIAVDWEGASATVALAATVAYQSGSVPARARVRELLRRLVAAQPGDAPGHDDVRTLYAHVALDPFEDRDERLTRLRRITRSALPYDRSFAGAAAWMLDEPELAGEQLRAQLEVLRAPDMQASSGGVLSALAWACSESGQLDGAAAYCEEASTLADAYTMPTVAASTELTLATILVHRGQPQMAEQLVASALDKTDTVEGRGFHARAHHALGLAASTQGNHVLAYERLRLLFHDAARPLHYYVSLLALGDLAAAARRADRLAEGRRLVARALDEIVGTPSPRLEQVFARARANVSPPGEAGPIFEVALADLEGERWPLERAALQLDYGEWLRRQRRIRDARDVLTPALETFRWLRAVPWMERTEAELRAAGVRADRAAARQREELTAREHEIATLAAQGLTNREIGDRLYLSPRTVGFHLYNVFPKLGIRGRAQLRAAPEATDVDQ